MLKWKQLESLTNNFLIKKNVSTCVRERSFRSFRLGHHRISSHGQLVITLFVMLLNGSFCKWRLRCDSKLLNRTTTFVIKMTLFGKMSQRNVWSCSGQKNKECCVLNWFLRCVKQFWFVLGFLSKSLNCLRFKKEE